MQKISSFGQKMSDKWLFEVLVGGWINKNYNPQESPEGSETLKNWLNFEQLLGLSCIQTNKITDIDC